MSWSLILLSPIQLIGLLLIVAGISMIVTYFSSEWGTLDKVMIILEAILFFAGAFLAIAFSVFAFVAAYTQSRVLLLTVS